MASSISAILILCIPYAGSSAQRNVHNMVVLLFVLLAALGLAIIAKRLKTLALGLMSATLVVICAIELLLLARYNAHPVAPWVWVILQLILTPLIITTLYYVAHELERRKLSQIDQA
jgi:ABC-type transport system involved in cytochrome c biogenesis permease subunit